MNIHEEIASRLKCHQHLEIKKTPLGPVVYLGSKQYWEVLADHDQSRMTRGVMGQWLYLGMPLVQVCEFDYVRVC